MTAEPPPDLEIAAEATARELRVWQRPEVEIRAAEQISQREHLPRPVQPRDTYRRVRVAMRAASRLTAQAIGRGPRL
jgi:hypothetical protein